MALQITTNNFRKLKFSVSSSNRTEENQGIGLGLITSLANFSDSNFKINVPIGAKIVGIAGSGDNYLRSIYAL